MFVMKVSYFLNCIVHAYTFSFWLLQRTSSSSSRASSVDKIAIKNLLQSRLLITQPPGLDEDDLDLDLIDFGDGRMSRDTDYETDLDMDYDGVL